MIQWLDLGLRLRGKQPGATEKQCRKYRKVPNSTADGAKHMNPLRK
jgi:hypothetical protein